MQTIQPWEHLYQQKLMQIQNITRDNLKELKKSVEIPHAARLGMAAGHASQSTKELLKAIPGVGAAVTSWDNFWIGYHVGQGNVLLMQAQKELVDST
jgi:hypothetical protein